MLNVITRFPFSVVCMQDSDPGPCQGYFNRWFFDASQLICKPFIFGGCRGNRNNFLTAEECSKACQIVVGKNDYVSRESEKYKLLFCFKMLSMVIFLSQDFRRALR